MIIKFLPDIFVDNIESINISELKEQGVKGFIIDIDNTLIDNTLILGDSVKAWVKKAKEMGIKVFLVSNGRKKKVEKIAGELEVGSIHRASKPMKRAFLNAAKLMNLKPEEIAVIGDQLFTDVYGGNKTNMITILVNPISETEHIFSSIKRPLERLILRNIDKSNYKSPRRKK
jgi:HAD superfamily phosphatase (TIGR01668 family)